MSDIQLRFSPKSVHESGSYQLLELPPELCNLVESSFRNASPLNLSIKGQASEDAVLCTQDKTYSVRSVVLSNTVLIVTPTDNGTDSVDVRDQVKEILELAPCIPRLHKLSTLLKDRTYDESQAGMYIDSEAAESSLTYEHAKAEIQASDGELQRAMKDRRILIINGALRPISPGYLFQILELLLNILVSLSLPLDSAPVDELVATLATDHEVAPTVTKQVMSWFGEIDDDRKWKINVQAVAKEMGLSILREHRHEPIARDALLARWKSSVGDTFESAVSLDLLSGNYLTSNEPGVSDGDRPLTYFPVSALPVDPVARFADLFLVRPRWKGEEMLPFLNDIAVDKKERDKLLLKHCRATGEVGSVWYAARTQYNG